MFKFILYKLCGRLPECAPPPASWPLTFDLESGVRVTCNVGYICANFILGLSVLSLGPMWAADVRQTSDHRLMTPTLGAGDILRTRQHATPFIISSFITPIRQQSTLSRISQHRNFIETVLSFNQLYKNEQKDISQAAHRLRGSAALYNGDVSFLWEKWKIWPPVKSKPLNRLTHNLSGLITSTSWTFVPNLVKIRSRGTSGQRGEI